MPRHHPFPTLTVPLVGMVHLPALPGAPDHEGGMEPVLSWVRQEVAALRDAGFDGVMVENYGDTPFHPESVPAETVAALTLAVHVAIETANGLPVGVNVLRNDARAALGIAAATGARFVRVNVHAGTMWTDQGPLVGRAHETLRVRSTLGTSTALLTDVHVKHATPPAGSDIASAATDLWERAHSDGVIVSGSGTGARTDPDRVARVRTAVPDAPLWVGSGATPESIAELLSAGADGFIVGSWIQREGRAGRGVDPQRAAAFVEAVRSRGG